MASTALSMEPWAVMRTTQTPGWVLTSSVRSAMPFLSGILRSVRITSKSPSRASSRAWRAFPATAVSYPSPSRIILRMSRWWRSSSTTRMRPRSVMEIFCPPSVRSRHGAGRISIRPQLLPALRLEGEDDAGGGALPGRAAQGDGAAVVRHDLVGEGEAQPEAGVLGGEIGLEGGAGVLLAHAVARVAHA